MDEPGLPKIFIVEVPEHILARVPVGEIEGDSGDAAVELAGNVDGCAAFRVDELHRGIILLVGRDVGVVLGMMLPVVPFHRWRENERADPVKSLVVGARLGPDAFFRDHHGVGFLAACLRDGYSYSRSAFVDIKPEWQPIFEPDASALGALGDAIYKINEAVPGFIGKKTMRQLTGLEGDDEQG